MYSVVSTNGRREGAGRSPAADRFSVGHKDSYAASEHSVGRRGRLTTPTSKHLRATADLSPLSQRGLGHTPPSQLSYLEGTTPPMSRRESGDDRFNLRVVADGLDQLAKKNDHDQLAKKHDQLAGILCRASQLAGRRLLNASQEAGHEALVHGRDASVLLAHRAQELAVWSWPHIVDMVEGAGHLTWQAACASANATEQALQASVAKLVHCLEEGEQTDDDSTSEEEQPHSKEPEKHDFVGLSPVLPSPTPSVASSSMAAAAPRAAPR